MDQFKYETEPLVDYSFRLIRLHKCTGDEPINCDLFRAWVPPSTESMEYEALSYTWGGTNRSCKIQVNNAEMLVTENLFLALHDLRLKNEDRILWIDAISINQGNDRERGHQVRQMASIYKEAERVIIWLGRPNPKTDILLRYMENLAEYTRTVACNTWTFKDDAWSHFWSITKITMQGRNYSCSLEHLQDGLEDLLSSPWFNRVWIIQEVANARSAQILCGWYSIPAHILALFPHLIYLNPTQQCQAILDVMPGPSRKESWWSQDRTFFNLLVRFRSSEASDERDLIYALLGLSNDAYTSKLLVPNYGKSVEDLITDVMDFFSLSPVRESRPSDVRTLLEDLESLFDAEFCRARSQGSTSRQKHFTEKMNPLYRGSRLVWAVKYAHEDLVKEQILNADVMEINREDFEGRTAISWAAQLGHLAIVKSLLQTGNINMVSQDYRNPTPLVTAILGNHEDIVSLLLGMKYREACVTRSSQWLREHNNTDITPLGAAIAVKNLKIAIMLVEAGHTYVNAIIQNRYTILSRARQDDASIHRLLSPYALHDEVSIPESVFQRMKPHRNVLKSDSWQWRDLQIISESPFYPPR